MSIPNKSLLLFMAIFFVSFVHAQTILINSQIPTIQSSAQLPQEQNCSVYIDQNFMILDYSLPWNWSGIATGNLSCRSINIQKWFFRYQDTNGNYAWAGVRIYLILSIILLVLIGIKVRTLFMAKKMFK